MSLRFDDVGIQGADGDMKQALHPSKVLLELLALAALGLEDAAKHAIKSLLNRRIRLLRFFRLLP